MTLTKRRQFVRTADESPSASSSVNCEALGTASSSSTMNDPLPPSLNQLPDEIVSEILSRLPVKSLKRFTSVCKSWRFLISNPQFVKKHLHLSARGTSHRTRQIIMSSNGRKHFFSSCSVYSLFNEPITHSTPLLHTSKKKRHTVHWIVGSCNGLVCVGVNQNTVLLWNPSVRKLNMLPHLDNKEQMGSFTVFGFGFDSLNDDYKVVAVYCYPNNDGSYETVVKVYSLRANSWKRIQEFPHSVLVDDSGKHVSGTLNWAAFGGGDPESSRVIESFDLANESYCQVPQPAYSDRFSDMTLGVIGDCLCILCHYYGTRADVWIMSEYGVKDSWNILFSLPYELEPGSFQYSIPLCLSEKGEILIEYKSQLMLFNPTNKTFRRPVIHNFTGCLEAVLCIESLVLPYAEEQEASVVL